VPNFSAWQLNGQMSYDLCSFLYNI
jgi:hypothetical protein